MPTGIQPAELVETGDLPAWLGIAHPWDGGVRHAPLPAGTPLTGHGPVDGQIRARPQGSRFWVRRWAGCDDCRMRVLIPLPDRDFDVTEVAVPWRILRDCGHQVVFATEQPGTLPAADPRLLDGVLFGQLGAEPEAKEFYAEL